MTSGRFIAVPADWLLRAVMLMNAMAGEGIGMEGCADPADLMCEIAQTLGAADADDMWEAAVQAIQDKQGNEQ